jgi:hypothetical protein
MSDWHTNNPYSKVKHNPALLSHQKNNPTFQTYSFLQGFKIVDISKDFDTALLVKNGAMS